MTAAVPSISAMPAPPNPDNRSTFNSLAYPWSLALGVLASQLAAVAANVKSNADEALAAAVAAENSQASASDSAATALAQKAAAVTAKNAAEAALASIQALITATGAVYAGGAFAGATSFAAPVDMSATVLSLGATKEKKVSITGNSATTVIDLAAADIFIVIVAANTTLNFTNAPTDGSVKSFTVITVNDATAGRALAFQSGVSFAGGILPLRTTTAGAKDAWSFVTTNGTAFTGSLSIKDY